MSQESGNRVTLKELERIEEAAHRSQSLAPETVLRLTAALREALQVKVNERVLCPKCHKSLSRDDLEVSIDREVRKCQN
jgi:hypothetical protein